MEKKEKEEKKKRKKKRKQSLSMTAEQKKNNNFIIIIKIIIHGPHRTGAVEMFFSSQTSSVREVVTAIEKPIQQHRFLQSAASFFSLPRMAGSS